MSLKTTLIRSVVATTVAATTLTLAPIAGAISGVDHAPDSDSYAHSVAYVSYTRSNGSSSGCTGVVVDPQWVLTTLHCLDTDGRFIEFPGQSEIALGSSGLSLTTSSTPVVDDPNTDPEVPATPVEDPLPPVVEPPVIATGSSGGAFGEGSNGEINYEIPEARNAFVRIGRNKNDHPRHRVTNIIQHPAGYGLMDLVLLKLDTPTTATPIPIRKESVTTPEPSTVYGFSSHSESTKTVRRASGMSKIDSQPTRLYTYFPQGIKTEPGDSGGPILINGELVALHTSTHGMGDMMYRSSSVTVLGETHDWIYDVIARRS